MKYRGSRAARHNGKRLSKFEYARFLAASLAHLMIHQQDAVGLVTFDAAIRRYIPARSRVGHLRVILRELSDTQAGEETGLGSVLHDIAERVHRRGLIVIISDLFDPDISGAEVLKALHHFRYRKHEVLLFHVMAEEELTFPFEQWSDFRDLELAGRNVLLDPRALRRANRGGLRADGDRLRSSIDRPGIRDLPRPLPRQEEKQKMTHCGSETVGGLART